MKPLMKYKQYLNCPHCSFVSNALITKNNLIRSHNVPHEGYLCTASKKEIHPEVIKTLAQDKYEPIVLVGEKRKEKANNVYQAYQVVPKEQYDSMKKKILEAIPSTWLDPLLTGKDGSMGSPPYDCLDIERLLEGVRKRLEEILKAEGE